MLKLHVCPLFFFRVFVKKDLLYSICVTITDVLVLNEDVLTNTFRTSCRKSTDFNMMCFICNDKEICHNNTYNAGDTGQCEKIAPRSF